jgi:hypothetical protein
MSQSSADSAEVLHIFSAGPTLEKTKRVRKKKADTPVVDTMVRRCTRSSVRNDGYRPKPIADECIQPRKRVRRQGKETVSAAVKTKGKVKSKKTASVSETSSEDNEEEVVPETPVRVLQQVGGKLGIDAAKLTFEKLTAPRSASQSSKSDNV